MGGRLRKLEVFKGEDACNRILEIAGHSKAPQARNELVCYLEDLTGQPGLRGGKKSWRQLLTVLGAAGTLGGNVHICISPFRSQSMKDFVCRRHHPFSLMQQSNISGEKAAFTMIRQMCSQMQVGDSSLTQGLLTLPSLIFPKSNFPLHRCNTD